MYTLKIIFAFVILTLVFVACDSNDPETPPAVKGKGWVYGEFQDKFIYDTLLVHTPDLVNWTSKETYDGTTHATLITKWVYDYEVQPRVVKQNTVVKDTADEWALFAFEMEEGTYDFTGSCEGYISETKSITVLPDTTVYLNFYLERE